MYTHNLYTYLLQVSHQECDRTLQQSILQLSYQQQSIELVQVVRLSSLVTTARIRLMNRIGHREKISTSIFLKSE